MNLTLEEYGWRCAWLECGRLSQCVGDYYTLKKVRDLRRKAKRGESSVFRKDGTRTEWTAMVEGWYQQEGGVL